MHVGGGAVSLVPTSVMLHCYPSFCPGIF